MVHAFLLSLALAGQSADAITTCRALHSGAAHEANIFLPNTCGRNLSVKALTVGPAVTWAALESTSHPKASRAVLIVVGAIGMAAAVHNNSVRRVP